MFSRLAFSSWARGGAMLLASGLLAIGCEVGSNDPAVWAGVPLGDSSGEGGSSGTDDAASAGATTGAGGAAASSAAATTGSGSTSTSGSGGSMMGDSGPCTLTYTVTTTSLNEKYSPENVGAIWITDSNGKYVQTLEEWGTIRIGNATKWVSASGFDTVDAVTGATAKSGKTHTAHWDCKLKGGAALPDGDYNVNEEVTSQNSGNGASRYSKVPFTKGWNPVSLTPADASGFTGQKLDFQ